MITESTPVYIYYDEISTVSGFSDINQPGSGALVCSTTVNTRVDWTFPNSDVIDLNSYIIQVRTSAGQTPSLSRLKRRPNSPSLDATQNGLWICRMRSSSLGSITVGVYERGRGMDRVIDLIILHLHSHSYLDTIQDGQ